ncbi:MAG: trigger factor [Blastocatellia bacterium]|nr:trigger factor [Blastocatellia bacterium]
MKVEITDLSACKKQIYVEIPSETVTQQFRTVTNMVARSATLPGFRKGRAPVSLVKNRFKKEIHEQVMRDLLPTALQSAIVENKLPIIGEPNLHELSLDDGKPLIFKAQVEIIPDIEAPEFRNLKVTKKVRIVTDEMVNNRLEAIREQHATLVPVEDREVQDGDYVTVDIKGRYSDQTDSSEELGADGVSFRVDTSETLKEFVENVRSMNIGDEKTFKTTYNQDHSNPKFAGREVEYTVKLQGIKFKELPELDDEFVQGIGEYQTLEEMRESVRKHFEDAAEKEAINRLRDVAVNKLAEGMDFEVPDVLVERQMTERVQNLQRFLLQNGLDPKQANFDWANVWQSQRQAAIHDVRCALIVEKIAEKEKVEVSQEEFEQEVAEISKTVGMSIEDTKSRLTKEDAIDSIKGRLRSKKALDLVINSAEIIEERVSSKELDQEKENEPLSETSEVQSAEALANSESNQNQEQ